MITGSAQNEILILQLTFLLLLCCVGVAECRAVESSLLPVPPLSGRNVDHHTCKMSVPDLKSCVAIEFHPRTSDEAINWLMNKIKADRQEHGCQLDVWREKSENGHTILLVSATDFRRRAGAEIFEIQKKHIDGYMREFSAANEHNFLHHEDDDFIADCEGLYVIKSELDLLRALDEDTHIPGHPKARLYPGKSILHKMQSFKLVASIICLHNQTKLDKLGAKWYRGSSLLEQPIEEIRNYFGDAIGVYFSFLGYYTKALIPLVALTVFFSVVSSGLDEVQSYSVFAVANLIWATVFLEMWKRKGAEVAYKFGSFQAREWEEPRGSYRGPLGTNRITGKQEPCYPLWKTKLRMCLVSWPAVSTCILAAVWLMFYYFSWDAYFAEKYDHDPAISSKLIRNLPSIAYACLVLIANYFYRILAEYLTDQENHRLESSYQNHLIVKIVLFDFVNNFLCLFYVAFVYNNISMLRRTLRNLFLIQIIVSQTLESVVPYWVYRRRTKKQRSEEKESDDAMTQVEMDLKRDIYAGTFDDYLELWLQFGYVVLFSCVFPFAAVLAFINNIVEIRSDAFKLSTAFRRPYSGPTRNIGAWQFALEIISYLGVVSNCALIFMSDGFQNWFREMSPSASTVQLLIVFFVAEHVLLSGRFFLSAIISDVPEHIKIKVAAVLYKSHQALKRRRAASLAPTEVLKKKLFKIRANAASSSVGSS